MELTSLFRTFAFRMAPLFVAMFGGFMSIGLPLPALPLFVTERLGLSTTAAGIAVGVQSLATLLTRLPAGRSVDAAGAKPTLVRGLLLACCAGAVMLLADLSRLHPAVSLPILLAGRLLLGVGESLLITGVLSWAIERAGPGQAGRAMSWNGMAQYGALAAGAPAGFALYRLEGFGVVAVASALAPLVALVLVLPLSPAPIPPRTARPAFRSMLRVVMRPGFGLMLAGIAFSAVGTFASLLFAHHGWPGAGAALSCYGACFVGIRVMGSRWADRYGGRAVAATSMAVAAAGQTCLWLAPDAVLALVGAGLTGAGCSLVFPALGVEAFRGVAPSSRGTAVAAFAAFQDLALGLTGPVLGTIATWLSDPSVPFALGAVACLFGLLLSLSLPCQPPVPHPTDRLLHPMVRIKCREDGSHH